MQATLSLSEIVAQLCRTRGDEEARSTLKRIGLTPARVALLDLLGLLNSFLDDMGEIVAVQSTVDMDQRPDLIKRCTDFQLAVSKLDFSDGPDISPPLKRPRSNTETADLNETPKKAATEKSSQEPIERKRGPVLVLVHRIVVGNESENDTVSEHIDDEIELDIGDMPAQYEHIRDSNSAP